ncbi:pyridoxal-phosphate-dependent aminotransferase family protein [Patulibacter minatonensis]|uniref:pyridoxal-phosphate-dependent aminotransferase family protein n=1 Tax=Patulibacter minatonensis TaxID=298163 RepID=UPI00047DD101|nr:aminotransferase class V-fold PLP-dependent enzyme [Patulibacter minatonensis]
MTGPIPNAALLDPPPMTPARFASIERDVARMLGTARDVVLLQAEAILALEAVARGLGVAGTTCLNVITGPYGAHFGEWLAAGGAEVVDLEIPLERAVRADEVAAVLERRPEIAVLSLVHAEVATGTVNPLAEIAAVAREHDVLTVVDAVASVGGHDLPIDELGLDVVMLGPQKALGGPAGISMVTVSDRAWAALAAPGGASPGPGEARAPAGGPSGSTAPAPASSTPTAPASASSSSTAPAPVSTGLAPWRGSILSLLDWKERWIDAGRSAIPGTPAVLELLALEAGCARVLAEGVGAGIARHARISAACRAGVRALGVEPWVASDGEACALTTAVRLPAGVDRAALADRARDAYGVALTPGGGTLRDVMVRIDHMGPAAEPRTALAGVAALGGALADLGVQVDVGAGVAATVAALAASA